MEPVGPRGGRAKGRGRGRGGAAGRGRGGRVWRPSAEVAQKFCGVWRYADGGGDQLEIALTDRGTLEIAEQDSSGAERAFGTLEPGEKRSLTSELTSGEGQPAGSIRVRHSENRGALLSSFREEGGSEWGADRVAHNALEPPPPKASAEDLRALAQEAARLREAAGERLGRGELAAAEPGLEAALRLLEPYERVWQGDKKPAASAAGEAIRELRRLHAETLLELARCCLHGEPARPARALECCEGAEALRELDARALRLKAAALAELGRPAEARAALAPAAILEPGDEGIVEELARLRPLAGDDRLLERAQQLRTEGNDWVKAGKVEWGAHRYEEALALLWGRPWPSEEELERRRRAADGEREASAALLRQAEVALLTNLSLCYLQGQAEPNNWPADPAHAVCLCKMALDVEPGNTKAMVRKARGHSDLYQYEEAVMQLSYAAELQPGDATVLRELSLARKLAEDLRKKARKWEKEAYRNMFDRISPGFATPAPEAGEDAGGCWPADALPTPLLRLGPEELDSFAEQLACTLEADGEGPYTMELLHAVRYAVELEFGRGAAKGLARTVPFVHVMTCGGGERCTFELGKGQRRLTSRLEGLEPEEPFHAAAAHAWCTALAEGASLLAAELQEQAGPELWEVPWAGDGAPPKWRSLGLVRQGAWVAGRRFAAARGLLAGLAGLRPYEVCFARLPPQAMLRHGANTNAVLTAHLPLQLGEGPCALCVGEHQREWRPGEAVVFDPTYVHFAANNSGADAYVLVCHFYHPGVQEVERYTLLFLEALVQRLQKTGLFAGGSLAPSPGIDVRKALKYVA